MFSPQGLKFKFHLCPNSYHMILGDALFLNQHGKRGDHPIAHNCTQAGPNILILYGFIIIFQMCTCHRGYEWGKNKWKTIM